MKCTTCGFQSLNFVEMSKHMATHAPAPETLTDAAGHLYYVHETAPSLPSGSRGYIATVRDAGSILRRGQRFDSIDQARAEAVLFFLEANQVSAAYAASGREVEDDEDENDVPDGFQEPQ